MITLDEALGACPVVAILRGVRPEEVEDVAGALFDAGLRAVEVPLNSPQPLDSIRRLAAGSGERMLCGAGTVLTAADAGAVADAGGRLVISPNMRPEVIAAALGRGLPAVPGVATATEAFDAIAAGAAELKLFPAVTYGPGHVRQLLAVLPPQVRLWAVGGVTPDDFLPWWQAGVRAFGLGSDLYRPGQTPQATRERALRAVEAAAALPA
jgi:2-dehydro-3-deoxyphosphogalactonate aldolase